MERGGRGRSRRSRSLCSGPVWGGSEEVERWRGGEVDRWRGGQVERWTGGEVDRWRGGEEGWRGWRGRLSVSAMEALEKFAMTAAAPQVAGWMGASTPATPPRRDPSGRCTTCSSRGQGGGSRSSARADSASAATAFRDGLGSGRSWPSLPESWRRGRRRQRQQREGEYAARCFRYGGRYR
jgi:hypothetical protein